MNKEFLAQQINRALSLFAQNLELTETESMEIADLYPKWQKENKEYITGAIIQYGVNQDGETQLYKVISTHTSKPNWTPDITPSLYKKIGFTPDGTLIWTQPLGGHDAYQTGDKVKHLDKIWVSIYDNNVWEPGIYGWTIVS